MLEYGITTLQTKPSLFKHMTISKIVDKRKHEELGYFISSKYKDIISSVIEDIERKEKIEKLKLLKKHQDLDFLEIVVDDGLV
ncbi:MAG: hypothetical protein U9R37_04265 [Campylobacterota bacterium]|nr:hypothetical protein [Campylobacterota bacterium]